jgi:hypothetical protein
MASSNDHENENGSGGGGGGKANFKVGVDNSPELIHEYHFSMAHAAAAASNTATPMRGIADRLDLEDDDDLLLWDHDANHIANQDDFSTLIGKLKKNSCHVICQFFLFSIINYFSFQYAVF